MFLGWRPPPGGKGLIALDRILTLRLKPPTLRQGKQSQSQKQGGQGKRRVSDENVTITSSRAVNLMCACLLELMLNHRRPVEAVDQSMPKVPRSAKR